MSMDFPIPNLALPPESLKGPRIALLSRALFSYHSRVVWGFLKQLEAREDLNWRTILFFCKEPHEDVMRAQMREIKRDGYDLILSVGALYSSIAMEHVRSGFLDVPLVYCGITDPVAMNLVSELKPEQRITGIVREQIPHTYLADFLTILRPGMKRVLVPYYDVAELGHLLLRLQMLKDRFLMYGIETILVSVKGMSDVMPAILQHIAYVDSVIIPEGNFISDVTSILADICKQYKVMLVGHHLERTGGNPAIIFTQNVELVGETLFSVAHEMLVDGKKPLDLPIRNLPNDRRIIVDVNACYEQGVDVNIDAIALFCVHNNIIMQHKE